MLLSQFKLNYTQTFCGTFSNSKCPVFEDVHPHEKMPGANLYK